MIEDEPITEEDRKWRQQEKIQDALHSILKELEREHRTADTLNNMLGTLYSISRGMWILTWLAIGGTIVAILKALS